MTDDPGLVKLAHDVTPMMLSVFARDPSSPAPQLTLLGKGWRAPRLRFKTRRQDKNGTR
jgi:hypothetical protein